MAGVASGGWGDSRPDDGILSKIEGGETSQALAERRSIGHLDSGTPSTSLPFWGIDEDDDCGRRPSELYGKYKWELNKFSQINKRELRSEAFEVGGYKWYILMYPQGCDVCNHLSLFLCVDNHDKLLPGWSHFAQFTIAMVNKTDLTKSKQSDTLHRFWKKEHDWGWKKFLELSKVLDAIDSDTLTIEAQVQVIREKASRPFRCLDCRYRRELVCVYLKIVEKIFQKFVEERRKKLGNLIEDKVKWSSFCAFWQLVDQKSRRILTREKTDSTLRVVVKELFIEKEVTSTLVMDSLYSGLKTLEGQIKIKQDRHKLVGMNGSTSSVRVEQDMFVLVDDVLLLLERAALDPLPPKDDKGSQNRMKDGSLGDDSIKGSIESDERRLTELGRRTIEVSVLAQIFSKIEAAYQEDIALKRQEELIREEAAWLETEQKSKRGAADKEKKLKKKQAKQKRNNRKEKDKGRDDDVIAYALDKLQLESPDENKDSLAEEANPELPNPETFEDTSDVSDTVDHGSEILHLNAEEREASPVNWDTGTSEVCGGASALPDIQMGIRETSGSCTIVDDSSYTCSTDSVPSVVMNGSYKPYPLPNQNSHRSPAREWKQRGRATSDMSGWVNEGNIRSSNAKRDVGPQNGSYGSRNSEPDTATGSLHDRIKNVEHHVVKRQIVSHQTEPSIKHQADKQRSLKEKSTIAPSSPISSSKNSPPPIQPKLEAKIAAPPILFIKRSLSDSPQIAPPVRNSADVAVSSRLDTPKPLSPPKPTQKPLIQQVPALSRPLSAPIVPGPKPSTPIASMVQSQPLISRSVSAVGRLAPEPTPVTHHQSYGNAIRGNTNNILSQPSSTLSGYTQPQFPNTALNLSQHYPTPANTIYPSIVPAVVYRPPMQNDNHALDIFKQVKTESPACKSGRQSRGTLIDEFPYLDIINDLLDDEYVNANVSTSTSFQNFDNVSPHLHRQYSYSGDIGMTNDMLAGPSTSPCRFEQTHSYHEPIFQPSYSSLESQVESSRDFYPQQNLTSSPNGQIDGLVANQWQVARSDLSYLNTNGGGHPYNIPDYNYNLAVNSNGYSVFRPSNGQ